MTSFWVGITILFLAYFFLLTLFYFIMAIIATLESRKRAMEDIAEDYAALSVSSFTIPVSILVPCHNEEDWIADCIQSLVRLDYPEFEIIIVDDGSTDNTLSALKKLLDLQPDTSPYRDNFASGKLTGIFKSRKYPYITLISKQSGHKKAGALNAALNLARYKYICVIDADTILEPDALLKVMAHIQKDPDKVIGAGSYFGLVNGFQIKDGKIVRRSFSYSPVVAYQNLEYIRTFIGNRIAWSRLGATVIINGGFALWRRDIVLEMGGYSSDHSSEDLEFTLRAHDYIVKRKKPYRIIMLPYCVGWTYGPPNIRSLIQQRDRWQRVVNEALWDYRHMIFNWRYRALGLITMPYYLFYETLGVFFELFSLLLVFVGAVLGFLQLKILLLFFIFMVVTGTIISLLDLQVFSRSQKFMGGKYIAYLGVLSFAELFFYRWINLVAKLSGTFKFALRVSTHDQFARQRN